jgi:coproporphyrinogen III oxidase
MASSLLSTPSQTLVPTTATARLRAARPAQVTFPRGLPRRGRVCASVAIEKEIPESEPPPTFLREDERGAGSGSVRGRFEAMIRRVQGEVCAALEEADGSGARFVENVWSRPGGGGGISRVLQDGRVFEKAGVNVSVVYGVMPPDAYRAAKGEAGKNGAADGQKAGPVPFFAAGISSVSAIHNVLLGQLGSRCICGTYFLSSM